MIIDTVIDALETALQTNVNWGNSVLWGNFQEMAFDYEEADLPQTLCHFESESDVQYSTKHYQTDYTFTVRGTFWNGSVISTKADYKKQTALDAEFVSLFRSFLQNLNCSALLSDNVSTSYESIENRFQINKTFTITIEEVKQ